jgi:aspartate carbamoyltransferase catalytic subunit
VTPHNSAHNPQHLLRLAGMPAETLRSLLARANDHADHRVAASTPLAGRTVATLFFEDSTRTRTSFTLAATRLGATVADLSTVASSVNKGESLTDTALSIEAMGVHAFICRTAQSGGPDLIASAVRGSVINAGDGRHEHPTQGLLDTLAIARAHARIDFDLTGLTVAIVGDCAHSRVARSDAAALTALGARVVLVGPPSMVSRSLADALNCDYTHDLDALLPEADAVQMLRVQFERGARIASPRQYRAGYALTAERARTMKQNAVVMHPGPMNRGIEIDGPVADSDGSTLPKSLVLEQIRLGVSVRMAALESLLAPPQTGSAPSTRTVARAAHAGAAS